MSKDNQKTKKNAEISEDELRLIYRSLKNGEKVLCKVCKTELVLRRPGSGYHPGIFCSNGCTEVLFDYVKK